MKVYTQNTVELCLFLVVQVLLTSGQVIWKTTVVVSPEGIDQARCGTSLKPCRSLDFALNKIGFNSTKILMKSGSFNYSSQRKIAEAEFFGIMGETGDSQDVLISCQGNASLAFLLSSNVLLQGIKFRNCGGLLQTTLYSNQMGQRLSDFSAALFFITCRNVRLFNVEISNTSGTGVFMSNVGGIVKISHAVFANNRPPVSSCFNEVPESRKSRSGGGLYVELNSNNFIKAGNNGRTSLYTHNSMYFLTRCSFVDNRLPLTSSSDRRLSRGGGLSVQLGGNASTNSFVISKCRFLDNVANMGGGIHVEMKEMAQNNTLRMQNSIFRENFVNFSGGGVRLENSIETEKALLFNTFTAINCSFVKNFAQTGGGVSVYGTTRPIPPRGKHSYVMAVFENCVWRKNTASAAAAIGARLVNLNEYGVGPLLPFHIVCVRCTIVENELSISVDEVLAGQGIIYTVQVPVVFQGNTSLCNNRGTVLFLESSTLEVHDTVCFVKNSGYRGGAIAMYGLSTIKLTRNSRLVFKENRANERGGAMFINSLGSSFSSYVATGNALQSCFFTYEKRDVDFDSWQTEIVFANNSTPGGASFGNSVYATSLKDCRRPGETQRNNSVFKWKIVRFEGQDNVDSEVSTDPIDIQYRAADWNVSPNECFNATVLPIDEMNTSVYSIVYIYVQGENKVNLATSSSFFPTNESVVNLRLNGKPKSRFFVTLATGQDQITFKLIKGLSLRDCNPGFKFAADSCVCDVSRFNGISRCSENRRDLYVRDGFWAGMVDGRFVIYRCPESYCTTCDESNGCLYTPGKICKEHRRGILCGSCEPGYTVLLGSEKCSPDCSNFYLLLFLPCAMILFLGIMLIILLNVDVFIGTLNAGLYSFQVMHVLVRVDTVFDPFIQFIIGLCYMQIKLGTCIMQGLDNADKLAFLYIFPYTTMVFMFILSRFVRAFPNCWFSRRVRAPFRGVCAVFVFCYTDLTMISLKILHPAHLGGRTVLFQEGNIGFFEGKHIAYGILAIFSMILIVIPFPLTLMFTPFFTKCLAPVLNLNNFKPYYDAFQGCLKDQYRWCSAFYFVARLYLLCVDTFVAEEFTKHVMVEAACVFILTVYVYLHPYKEEYNWINKLDAVLLTNVSLIAMINADIDIRDPSIDRKATVVVLKVLSYTPLGYLLVLLGVVWYKRYFSTENGLAVQGYISAPSSSSTTNQDPPALCDEVPGHPR